MLYPHHSVQLFAHHILNPSPTNINTADRFDCECRAEDRVQALGLVLNLVPLKYFQKSARPNGGSSSGQQTLGAKLLVAGGQRVLLSVDSFVFKVLTHSVKR